MPTFTVFRAAASTSYCVYYHNFIISISLSSYLYPNALNCDSTSRFKGFFILKSLGSMSWHWFRPDLKAQFISQSAYTMSIIYIYDRTRASLRCCRFSSVEKHIVRYSCNPLSGNTSLKLWGRKKSVIKGSHTTMRPYSWRTEQSKFKKKK